MGNATYLFEKNRLKKENNEPDGFLDNSESYWTTLFGFFLLHLAQGRKDNRVEPVIRTWKCIGSEKAPFYDPKPKNTWLDVSGLTSEGIAVEPADLDGVWKGSSIDGNASFTGIRPDIVLKINGRNETRYVLIENKTTTKGKLQENQMHNYPRLIKALADGKKEKIICGLVFLQSVGCHGRYSYYDQAMEMEKILPEPGQFAIILWEDVIRQMINTGFQIAGLDFQGWGQYAEDGKTECKDWLKTTH